MLLVHSRIYKILFAVHVCFIVFAAFLSTSEFFNHLFHFLFCFHCFLYFAVRRWKTVILFIESYSILEYDDVASLDRLFVGTGTCFVSTATVLADSSNIYMLNLQISDDILLSRCDCLPIQNICIQIHNLRITQSHTISHSLTLSRIDFLYFWVIANNDVIFPSAIFSCMRREEGSYGK